MSGSPHQELHLIMPHTRHLILSLFTVIISLLFLSSSFSLSLCSPSSSLSSSSFTPPTTTLLLSSNTKNVPFQVPLKTEWRVYLLEKQQQQQSSSSSFNQQAIGFIREDSFLADILQPFKGNDPILRQFYISYDFADSSRTFDQALFPQLIFSETTNTTTIEFSDLTTKIQYFQQNINTTHEWTNTSLIYVASGEQVNRFLCWCPTFAKQQQQQQQQRFSSFSMFHLLDTARFDNETEKMKVMKRLIPPYDTDRPLLENGEWPRPTVINNNNNNNNNNDESSAMKKGSSATISSATSSDFVWSAMNVLYSVGARNIDDKTLRFLYYQTRDLMTFVTDTSSSTATDHPDDATVRIMDMSQVDDREQVAQFYTELNQFIQRRQDGEIAGSNWLSDYKDFIVRGGKSLGDDERSRVIMYYQSGQYYRLNLTEPYLIISHRVPVTIPNSNPEHAYTKKTVEYSHDFICLKFGPALPERSMFSKDVIIVLGVLLGLSVLVSFVSATLYLVREIRKRRRIQTMLRKNKIAMLGSSGAGNSLGSSSLSMIGTHTEDLQEKLLDMNTENYEDTYSEMTDKSVVQDGYYRSI